MCGTIKFWRYRHSHHFTWNATNQQFQNLHRQRIWQHEKVLHLNSCILTSLEKTALVGLDAFNGNDYVSSFLRKVKPLCWKQASANPIFLDIFSQLGTESHVSEEVFGIIEKYVCFLYGQKKIEKVNEAKSAIFWRKISQEHKIVDISQLPPCSDSLRKHVARANYVARIWRRACYPLMAMEDT